MLRQSILAVAFVLVTRLAAQTVVLTPTSTQLDLVNGGTLIFNASVIYSTPTSVLAFSTTLPANWTYVSTSSGGPDVTPSNGASGTIGWAYALTPVPASPATFGFSVHYPGGITGLQPLGSESVTRDQSGSPATTAPGPTVTLAVPTGLATWNGATANWQVNTNWSNGVVPNNGTPADSTYAATIAGGTVTLTSAVTVNDLLFTGGTITGTSSLTVAGSGSNWGAGVFSSLNQLIVTPDAFFTATGNASHDFGGTAIVNNGQFIWNDGGSLRSGNSGSFVNANGATFTDASSGGAVAITNSGITGSFTFTNQGTYIKTGATETKIEIPFTNQGTILVNAGNLHFDSTFTQNAGNILLAAGAISQFDNGLNLAAGSLSGSGTIAGNVTNSAALSPGSILGQLTIQGNLGLLATSQLIFDLGGTTQGVTYDFLSVSGTATFGGTLTLNVVNGARTTILPTDNFTLLTASSISGAFTNVASGTRLFTSDGVSSFLVTYGPSGLTLSGFSAIPEPSTWTLLVVGLGALAIGARRRARTR